MLFGVNEDVALPLLAPRRKLRCGTKAIAGITGKAVMVTGAGGSIGSELVRQIASASPKELHMIDHSELNMYEVMCLLDESDTDFKYYGYLSDIRTVEPLDAIVSSVGYLDTVLHAAALKHVPLLETKHNYMEALTTNVLGTLNMHSMARQLGAKKFVQISTDKAVYPSSFMGVTKRVAELALLLRTNSELDTTIVRFGNVIGSSGSVIPHFRRQIAQGGPVTVTHPDMTRYLMTIRDAVKLTLEAIALPESGIAVLDMGEPVNITDLAGSLIRQMGLEPGDDIAIVYTGIRLGEKLEEELVYSFETEKILLKTDRITVYDGSVPEAVEPLALNDLTEAIKALRSREFSKVMRVLKPLFTKLENTPNDWMES